MTISTVIGKVERLKPNAMTAEDLISFINEVERDIVIEALGQEFTPVTDKNQELSAPELYDNVYFDYVCAKIDYFNGNIDNYSLSSQQFNTTMKGLKGYCIRKGLTPGFTGKRINYI